MLSSTPSGIVALALLCLLLQPCSAIATTVAPKPESAQGVQKTQQKDAEPSIVRLGGDQVWSAYSGTEKGHKICYVEGTASKSEPGDVKRARVFVSITHRPAEKVRDEVSFNSGYLFKEGSKAELLVDGKKFMLFTNKDGAWADDAPTDRAVVSALAKGKQAVIKGTSVRGTQTTDTYTMAGFGQALSKIDKACGVKR
jgi:Invasion associated locus B (IalB) protein